MSNVLGDSFGVEKGKLLFYRKRIRRDVLDHEVKSLAVGGNHISEAGSQTSLIPSSSCFDSFLPVEGLSGSSPSWWGEGAFLFPA